MSTMRPLNAATLERLRATLATRGNLIRVSQNLGIARGTLRRACTGALMLNATATLLEGWLQAHKPQAATVPADAA